MLWLICQAEFLYEIVSGIGHVKVSIAVEGPAVGIRE